MTPDDPEPGGSPFRILYVCVGNLCRSVFAERLTRHEIDRQPPSWARHFTVGSAGTRARDGEPMHPYTEGLMVAWAVDTGGFTTRRLTAALLRDTDLVLTATGRERDDVVDLLPATLQRTFTVNEFVRLVAWQPEGEAEVETADDPAGRARRVVSAALALRGRVPAGELPPIDAAPSRKFPWSAAPPGRVGPTVGRVSPDDIADPERNPDAFLECGQRVKTAAHLIVRALRGASQSQCWAAAATSVPRGGSDRGSGHGRRLLKRPAPDASAAAAARQRRRPG